MNWFFQLNLLQNIVQCALNGIQEQNNDKLATSNQINYLKIIQQYRTTYRLLHDCLVRWLFGNFDICAD